MIIHKYQNKRIIILKVVHILMYKKIHNMNKELMI